MDSKLPQRLPGAALDELVPAETGPAPVSLFGGPAGEVVHPFLPPLPAAPAARRHRTGDSGMTLVEDRHHLRTPEYWNSQYAHGVKFRQVSSFEASMFRAYVDPEPGMFAVDVGCGQGDMTARMATWGLDVIGVDFSPLAVTRARRRHQGIDHLNFRVHDFNVDAIPVYLRPRSVDLMVCRLSLAFLDRERFLVDVKRWLKPEGVLHITTSVHERTRPGQKHRGLTQDALKQLEQGWHSATRYDLENDGSVTCLVLRSPS